MASSTGIDEQAAPGITKDDTTTHILTTTICRMLASALTWPVEKTKLLYQSGGGDSGRGGSLSSKPILSRNATADLLQTSIRQFVATPGRQHILGMVSSAFQRGGSAFFMFTCQNRVYDCTNGIFDDLAKNKNHAEIYDHFLAGILSGAVTAPFHTYWELCKVRGGLPNSWTMYKAALHPMILRHSVFDGVFFGVFTACDLWSKEAQYHDKNTENTFTMSGILSHSGFKFGLAAASASFANLLFDVWKTTTMQSFPIRVRFATGVVYTMTPASFLSNYAVKGTDLTVNWIVVGCLKDQVVVEQMK